MPPMILPDPKESGLDSTCSGLAEVNGTSLYYEVAGSGEPIVFIHGNVGDCRHFDGQFSTLAKDFRVARYDLRGYGKSKVPTKGVAYRDFEDLRALLDFLEMPSAHVVGFSLGAGVATDLAIAHPDRVRSLNLVGPWVFGYLRGRAPEELSASTLELAEAIGAVAATFAEQGKEKALQRWGEYVKPFAVVESARRRLAEIAVDYSFFHFQADLEPDTMQFLRPWAYGRLEEIQCPVLVVTSEKDMECCREVSEEVVRRAPDAREIDVEGIGHLIPLEIPVEFSKIVGEFVSEQSKPG